jgi:hypothetical protein
MNIEQLLNIESLMADTTPEGNYRRHRRMMTLWGEGRRQRKLGDFAMAERLKAAGNRLHARNEAGWRSIVLDAG